MSSETPEPTRPLPTVIDLKQAVVKALTALNLSEGESSNPNLDEDGYKRKTSERQEALQAEYQGLLNKNEKLLIELRQKYGDTIVKFLWVYFIFMINCVLFSSIGFVSIDPLVLAAIVGGTAVSVLGVVGTVAAGLFRTSK
jgi:hypothetical protein